MAIRPLDLSDRSIAESVLELQRAAYVLEAELIGFDGIPPLHESLEELQSCMERFLGAFDRDHLVGLVSWRRLLDGTLDLCRLAVAPSSQRRGWATRLLEALDAAEPAARATVSTGTANSPAIALYRRRGFRPVEQRQIAVGVTVTQLVRSQQTDFHRDHSGA